MTDARDADAHRVSDAQGPAHHVVHDTDKTAGIVSRGIAAFIDLATVWALLGSAYIGFAVAMLVVNASSFSFPNPGPLFTAAGLIVASIGYNTLCWAISGRTLGCVVMGLRVRGRKRDVMRPSIALIRAVFYTFFPIGLAWAAVDLRRRSIQDVILGTRVIYSR
ncbi:RDD family protein [Gordonia sp. HNM0687]|uniref:RDD family protein n=1 Tax=Gordonia mangrovi TaxID=2665643 RepID=A0A6L7GTH8_9ACTN|nr:RDD family protein [Gordonia mangrovi]MDY6808856.1 RDD family protein [Actinomycetota bacterium]MXP22772.1 RDD family protein [Gordonia mangrovi]UVF77086.1 RDD family protein [Gordonia mangrovi]